MLSMKSSVLILVLLSCLFNLLEALTTSTTVAAGSTAACADTATNCAQLANLCQHRTYVLILQEHCKKTCGVCPGGCTDSSTRCASWNRNGFCQNQYYTNADKQKYCANTCNLCASG